MPLHTFPLHIVVGGLQTGASCKVTFVASQPPSSGIGEPSDPPVIDIEQWTVIASYAMTAVYAPGVHRLPGDCTVIVVSEGM